MKRVFVSACEGPIATNDNALELASHFIPEGGRVYDLLCQYDYLHARLWKKNGYGVGNVSKLILPFLLAFGANNQNVEEFCAQNLALLKGSRETLSYLQQISNASIMSTSYEHFMRALCKVTGFSLESIYCTRINFDLFDVNQKEQDKLRGYAWEIAGLPIISIPPGFESSRDFSKRDQETLKRLDEIFWKKIASMHCKRVFSDVHVPSGQSKAQVVGEIATSVSSPLSNLMYVGSDYTDAEAIRLVRSSGGFAVSVNGDSEAVKNAEVAVLTDNSATIAVLADLFLRFGKAEVLDIAGNFDRDYLWRSKADPSSLDRVFELHPDKWPKVYVMSEWNMESVVKSSEAYRDTVKGEPPNLS